METTVTSRPRSGWFSVGSRTVPTAARTALTLALPLALLLTPVAASAHIKDSGDHTDYKLELEPQLLVPYFDDLGVGLRASIELADPAFIPSINNTVAITFGAGYVWSDDDYWCRNWNGRNNGWDCRGYAYQRNWLWLPVAAQWNFWFTDMFSAFGELGLGLQVYFTDRNYCDQWGCYDNRSNTGIEPLVAIGGRIKFNDKVGITGRLGHPSSSVGISIFF